MKRTVIVFALFIVATSLLLFAQGQAPNVPTLTPLEKLQLENVNLRMELARVRMQLLQLEFEQDRTAATALLQSLQRTGYVLDLNRMEYVPQPPAVPATDGGTTAR